MTAEPLGIHHVTAVASHPGTILTFFPWPKAPRGRRGAGQTSTVSFSVPQAPLGYWKEGMVGAGTVHHVAWRAPDGDTQAAAAEDPRLTARLRPGATS